MLSLLLDQEGTRLLITLIFIGIGVYGKDYSDMRKKKAKKIHTIRVILVMIIITTLIGSFENFLRGVNDYFFLFICIASGWANYDVFGLVEGFGSSLVKFAKAYLKKSIGEETDQSEKIDELFDEVKKLKDISNKPKELKEDKDDKEENDGDSA